MSALLCMSICCSSCSDTQKSTANLVKPVVSYENETLNITSLDSEQHDIQILIGKKEVFNGSYTNVYKSNISQIAKGYGSNYDLALMAASSMQTGVALNIKVDELLDTIVFATIEPMEITNNSSNISGNCAKLITSGANPQQDIDIKKWLFRKNKQLGDYQIKQMKGILAKISSSGYNDYVTNDKMPVLKSFAGLSYRVTSDMKADHYVLYATSSDKEIKDFVEETVANDFELTSKTTNGSMNCYRKTNSNGYKCIVLVGINDNWTYQVEPLGLVAIDNIAPSRQYDNDGDFNTIILKGNKRVIFPSSKPQIFGYANVTELKSDGNGVSCNVTFKVDFGGDIKSVTVIRGIYGPDRSWCSLKDGKKYVTMADKQSPYVFTYPLHLVDGDNIVPVILEDYHGNTTRYEINIPASFTRHNPDVQIDNNINVW